MFLMETKFIYIWASTRQNLSSGFLKKRGSNQSPKLNRLSSLVASLDIILSKKRITKALIRLRGCAGWSAPVLFANHRKQVFSCQGPFYEWIFCKSDKIMLVLLEVLVKVKHNKKRKPHMYRYISLTRT